MLELIVSFCFAAGYQPPEVKTSCNNVAIQLYDDSAGTKYAKTPFMCLQQAQPTIIEWARKHPWIDVENRAYNISMFNINYMTCKDIKNGTSQEF